MVKKVFEDNTEAIVDEDEMKPAIKQMVRTITADSVFSVDDEIATWLDKDYKLLTAHVLIGGVSEFSVFYVLVRQ